MYQMHINKSKDYFFNYIKIEKIMAELNTSVMLGKLQLKNRVVMSPLTRSRATDTRVPTDLMVQYYAQRASAGLIISEATVISEEANGYLNTPGLYSAEQVVGWKKVTDAVHAKGGLMVAQLWHVGRISHPDLLNGETPVAPSAIKPAGQVSLLRPKRDYVTPRALETAEVKAIVQQFKESAVLARYAGFDGVMLHAGNGYLIDQFLQSKTNTRNDEYGGSLENRARFTLEIMDALIEIWGASGVSVHFAPLGDDYDMGDANPKETFGYVMQELAKRQIGFFFTRENISDDSISQHMRAQAGNVPYIANMGLTRDSAIQLLESGQADAVAFGKAYIANPDLYERLVQDVPLNELKFENMIGSQTAEGYVDYPSLSE